MRSVTTAAVALSGTLLGACYSPGLDKAAEYQTSKAVYAPGVQEKGTWLDQLAVYLHPKIPGRAMVQPAPNRMYGIALSTGFDQADWLAHVPAYRQGYDSALRSVIEKGGMTCSITNAQPIPDAYIIEYAYECSPATSPP